MTLEPVLTPHGLLTLRQTGEALVLHEDRDGNVRCITRYGP